MNLERKLRLRIGYWRAKLIRRLLGPKAETFMINCFALDSKDPLLVKVAEEWFFRYFKKRIAFNNDLILKHKSEEFEKKDLVQSNEP